MSSPISFLRPFFLCSILLSVSVSSAIGQDEFSFRMSSPVDCTGLDLCFVQNYMDHDAGPAWRDYHCRHLSYDGHNGTDIRVSYDDMRRGVPVLAVADGVVLGLRDGMEDVDVNVSGKEALHGKFAGNAVYIDHNGGIETQYSHLMKGSIAVEVGDFVERGQVIGMVGLSGNTEFPHVELGVFEAGSYVDPFGGSAQDACGQQLRPLWDENAMEMLAYQPHGVLDGGFVNVVPDLKTVLLRPKRPFHPDLGKRMIFWAAFYGVSKGDKLHISIADPRGKVVTARDLDIEDNYAQKAVYVSIRTKNKWTRGTYVGRSELTPAEMGDPVVLERRVTIP